MVVWQNVRGRLLLVPVAVRLFDAEFFQALGDALERGWNDDRLGVVLSLKADRANLAGFHCGASRGVDFG